MDIFLPSALTTRMHSSRMRTGARRPYAGVCFRGGLPGPGGSAWSRGSAWSGGGGGGLGVCLVQEGLPGLGVCLVGGLGGV